MAPASRAGSTWVKIAAVRRVRGLRQRAPYPYATYKGRIVFRGDTVRDENGVHAVFSEQGTSASNLAAAKFIDAIARFPGCDGENANASSAYTQVSLEELEQRAKLLRLGFPCRNT